MEEVGRAAHERDRRVRVAEEDHPQIPLGEDRALLVQPVGLLRIGDEDHEGALLGPREAHGVRVDLEVGVRRQELSHQLAQPLGAGAVDEDEDPFADEPEDPAQPDEPGGLVRTMCIVRSGCGKYHSDSLGYGSSLP